MRYKIENHVANSSTTYNVIGPDGHTVAAMFNRDIPEGARLRAYIEAHDYVMEALRETLDVVRDWASTEAYEQIGSKIQTLLAQIQGGGGMSRYEVKDNNFPDDFKLANNTYFAPDFMWQSKLCVIRGQEYEVIGKLLGKHHPDVKRLTHYIEAHDEVMNILRNVGRISKRGEMEAKAEALLTRIEGEEER